MVRFHVTENSLNITLWNSLKASPELKLDRIVKCLGTHLGKCTKNVTIQFRHLQHVSRPLSGPGPREFTPATHPLSVVLNTATPFSLHIWPM